MRIFLLFLLISFSAYAESDIIQLPIESEKLELGKQIFYFIDKEGTLTIDDIANPDHQNLFIKNTSDTPEFGFLTSPIWLKFTIQELNSGSREWFLEIAYSSLDKIEFYNRDGGKWVTKYAGDEYPFSNRELFYRNFGFFVMFPPLKEETIYIKIHTTSAAIIPLNLYQKSELLKKISYTESWHFIFYGVLLVMIFYNGFISISLRSITYFLYSLCTLLMLNYQVAFNGHGFQYLWSNNIWFQKYGGFSSMVLFPIFVFEFMIRFLDLRKNVRYFLRIWLVVQSLIFVFAISNSFIAALKVVSTVGIINTIIVLTSGILSWIKKYRPARFFVIAWSVYSIGTILAILRLRGVVETNYLTTYAMQIGIMIELVFLSIALADRYKLIMDENSNIQKELLDVHVKLVENLKTSESVLEERVIMRTTELQASNKTLESTLHNLKTTQVQLIQSEKMASLGQLVANVAHEINTPIGAVKASGKNIADALDYTLENLPTLFIILEKPDRELFMKLINQKKEQTGVLSTKEERALVRETTRQLEEAGVKDSRDKAEMLVQLNAHSTLTNYLSLLNHPENNFIFKTARSISTIVNSATNINMAVDKVSKIIFALKSFSRMNDSEQMMNADLRDGIEIVLTIYNNQIKQGIEVIRNYDEIQKIHCFPDELNQVWTNLIHNAIQAMPGKGKLTISVRKEANGIVVAIADTGSGIPESILPKIFEPFFTTKPAGEGSGLGLDISKRIIDKHKGRIEVKSEVGAGTEFLVFIPMGSVDKSEKR